MANYSAGGQTVPGVHIPCTRSNTCIPGENRYQDNVLLDAAPVGHFGNPRTHRTVLFVVWHVALLGSGRSVWPVGKADVVRCPTRWFLVGKLPILLFRVSSSSISESKGRGLRTMFRRILVAGWTFIFGSVALMGLFPKLATRLPRSEFLFIFLFTFVLISFVYGVYWLYRQGMKRARSK